MEELEKLQSILNLKYYEIGNIDLGHRWSEEELDIFLKCHIDYID